MAKPPLPMDQLTLLFEAAKYGGLEKCAVYLPAGHQIMGNTATGRRSHVAGRLEGARGHWYAAACVSVYSNVGRMLRGEEAVLCIAAQQLSIQMSAQITQVAPAKSRPCECQTCHTMRASRDLSKLIGLHPDPSED